MPDQVLYPGGTSTGDGRSGHVVSSDSRATRGNISVELRVL